MALAKNRDIYKEEYLIQRAIELITSKLAHIQDEPKPTLFHCMRVGIRLFNYGYSTDIVIGGLLHDCIEDSDVTYDDIVQKFGEKVAILVLANTVDTSIAKEQRKKEVVERCLATSKEATVIMAAEILDGLEFYQRAKNKQQLHNKIDKAKTFLQKNRYSDKIFDQLATFIEKNEK